MRILSFDHFKRSNTLIFSGVAFNRVLHPFMTTHPHGPTFMISRILKSLKKNPIQSVILLLLFGYFATYAFTGTCPMQLMGDRFGGATADSAVASADGEAFNLHDAAMDFELVDGTTLNSSDFEGKATVVNYWATWCGPCVREIPAFNKISKEKSDEVQFIGISLDNKVSAVHQFFNRLKIEYPVAHGDLRLTELTGPIRSIPTTLFFDREGNYAGKVVGSISERRMLKKIESL